MKFHLAINPKEEALKITTFIKETVRSRGFKCVVIACSGGVDSTTSLYLAVRALGKENVIPTILPYGELNRQGYKDAEEALSALGINKQQQVTIDIQPMVEEFKRQVALKQGETLKQRVRIGNIMARCRMIVLFDQAKKHKALVLGTENKSEHYLGYFTRFGDEASDVEPIRHLYKTQVYELARYLSVPQSILKKAPTAGLWVDQTDEGQFGFRYRDADPILQLLYEKKQTAQEVVKIGFPKSLVLRVKDWVDKNRFKHELPMVIHSRR